MYKLLILTMTAAAVLLPLPSHAGRDGAQLLLQEKANKEAVARRQCARELAKLYDEGTRAQVPESAPSMDEARRKQEIAACVERLKKGN